MAIIVIGNQKGGVGKTTLAINLAVELTARGLGTAIVEVENTMPVSAWAQDREATELAHIDVLHKSGKMAKTLRSLDEKYDVVIVDTPGKDSPEMRSALVVADLFVVPAIPAQVDVDTTLAMYRVVDQMEEINPDMVTAIVINMAEVTAFDKDKRDALDVLRDTYKNVVPTALGRRKIFRNAYGQGAGVVELKARTDSEKRAQAEVQKVVDHIIALIEGDTNGD